MNLSRLSAAGVALALHVATLAAVIGLGMKAPILPQPQVLQVQLLAPPQPLPMAVQAASTDPPAATQPTASKALAPLTPHTSPPPPATRAPARAPKAGRHAARPTQPPPASAQATATQATVAEPRIELPEREPLTAKLPDAVASETGTATTGREDPGPPSNVSGAAASIASAADSSTVGATAPARAAPAGAARSAPRVDASWSGNTPPPYPGMARRLGEQGEVRLDVHVGADGRVLEVRLTKSSGSTLLDRTAIETVKGWRFHPATSGGRAVAAWYHDWRWVFRLEG